MVGMSAMGVSILCLACIEFYHDQPTGGGLSREPCQEFGVVTTKMADDGTSPVQTDQFTQNLTSIIANVTLGSRTILSGEALPADGVSIM